MKSIDEYTKEELYTELVAMTTKAECLQDEVDRLYRLVMKALKKDESTSSSKADVRINI